MQNAKIRKKINKVLLYLLLCLLALIYVLPFLQIIGNSLKTYWETQEIPPKLLPKVPQWRNYMDIW